MYGKEYIDWREVRADAGYETPRLMAYFAEHGRMPFDGYTHEMYYQHLAFEGQIRTAAIAEIHASVSGHTE